MTSLPEKYNEALIEEQINTSKKKEVATIFSFTLY